MRDDRSAVGKYVTVLIFWLFPSLSSSSTAVSHEGTCGICWFFRCSLFCSTSL